MAMTGAKRVISCYDITTVALPKFLALSNISPVSFGNFLKVILFTCLCTKFAKDITWCLFWSLCSFKTATLCWHGYMAEEWTITTFAKVKKSNSFSNFLNSSLFVSTPYSSHNSLKIPKHIMQRETLIFSNDAYT